MSSAAPPEAADWLAIVHQVAVSRALDDLEESVLVPERKVLYQFSARGHDVTQVLLGQLLTGARDALGGYYRSRPLMLTLGLTIEEALASSMMRVGSMSEGRDIGVVFNLPRRDGPCALPVCGGVGTQYTPAVGWAQALRYREEVLGDTRCARSIAVAHGGDASTATNGFWSALNIATTQRLPLLFFIEDNGYGISVPTEMQTPGGNIAHNLRAFRGLSVLDGDGSDPLAAAELMREAVGGVRAGKGPALLRLTVPRLSGHSGQDTQTYKGSAVIAAERERDPWGKLRAQLVPASLSAEAWDGAVERARAAVGEARERVEKRSAPDPKLVRRYVFTETSQDGAVEIQAQGGLWADGALPARGSEQASPQGPRINLVTAVRRTLEHELEMNARVVVFGEDVGRKGGVHAATLGLQEKFGVARVFDTSLSEEGIIGRHGGGGPHAGARDPVSQVRRSRSRAAERLRLDALADGESFCRADGGAHSRRILQVRRSLAQSIERGAVGARDRLARRHALERRGRRRIAAHGFARQRPDHILRASRAARFRCSASRVPRRRFRPALRPGESPAERRRAHGRHLGRDGRSL